MISGPDGSRYYDTSLNVNGEWTEHSGYQTHILRDYALDFLRQAREEPDPFFLLYSPYAPHLLAVPAPGDEELYADLPPHNPPNFNPEDMSGKPHWMGSLPLSHRRADGQHPKGLAATRIKPSMPSTCRLRKSFKSWKRWRCWMRRSSSISLITACF